MNSYANGAAAHKDCTCSQQNSQGCASLKCKNCGPTLDQRQTAMSWVGATSALIVRDLNRVVPIGIETFTIAAGQTQAYSVKTQFTSMLQIFWMHIDPELAKSLTVLDLKIGRQLVFGNEQEVSATLFNADYLKAGAVGGFPSEIISNSVEATFTLKNVSLADVTPQAALLARTCS